MMVNLAVRWPDTPVSTRELAKMETISYPLACKLLQALNQAGLVSSSMGPAGGFQLAHDPKKISFLDVIGAIQGPVALNRCLMDLTSCQRARNCPISKKLKKLQNHIDKYLTDVTLTELVPAGRGGRKRR